MNQYKLRKDVDELQISLEQTQSGLEMLKAVTLNGTDYYTKDEVDTVLDWLNAKSEGLPYFFKDASENLIMDLPLGVEPYFRLSDSGDLIVDLPEGVVNHFSLDVLGNLIYDTDLDGE